MQISPVNNTNNIQRKTPSFGHSFRVSICLKDDTGFEKFISPATDKKLYKELNSKIVGWLNENYYSRLREFLGIERKTKKTEPLGNTHKEMIDKLKTIDSDYNKFDYTRSVYNGGRLGYIVTGADVSIVENLKAAKFIGKAKSDSKRYYGTTMSDYVKNLTKLVKQNMREYVKSSNILLRSKNNKEIMLRAVFKESGKNKRGVTNYELDRFEFHENKTLPELPPLNDSFIRYKYSGYMNNEIKNTVRYHADKMSGTRHNYDYIDKFFSK